MPRDTPLHGAVTNNEIRKVKDLIASGANLEARDSNDLTPLLGACCNGKVMGSRIAMLLIEAGANVNYVRKGDDQTALMFAAEYGTPELVQALIDHPGERDVVRAGGEDDEDRRNRQRECSQAHPLPPPCRLDANPQALHGHPRLRAVISRSANGVRDPAGVAR